MLPIHDQGRTSDGPGSDAYAAFALAAGEAAFLRTPAVLEHRCRLQVGEAEEGRTGTARVIGEDSVVFRADCRDGNIAELCGRRSSLHLFRWARLEQDKCR